MKTLSVELGERGYPIHIGPGLINRAELLRPVVADRPVAILTNTIVEQRYLQPLLKTLGREDVVIISLPDGERQKNLSTFESIVTELLERRFDRAGVLLALGGGVVGDIAGFVAACYLRGIDYVQIPTTLLAQVDSSVGGKTAVNHALGKNMIGAFYQPCCVIADTDTLATLPDREYRAGIAEVIKYGLIRDPEFFNWLEEHAQAIAGKDSVLLGEIISRSCENKVAVVAADEREGGVRAILNLGHSFGHALEVVLGYGTYLHGEAVAVGMVMAAELSQRLGWLPASACERLNALLNTQNLPTKPPPGTEADAILAALAFDKKVHAGRLRLVLLKSVGEAMLSTDYSDQLLDSVVREACEG
jgi:3-dehydroquinate synthase